MSELLHDPELRRNLINSLVLFVILFLTKWGINRWLVKSTLQAETKRLWRLQSNLIFKTAIIIGLALLWGAQLKNFAVSIITIAAAIVIATKELILCFLGGIYIVSTRPFRIGDRIQVSDFKGDVFLIGPLNTTLFEIGPKGSSQQYTGKTLVLPNVLFLSNTIFKESGQSKYNLHTFSIFLKDKVDIIKTKETLLKAAKIITDEYIIQAKKSISQINKIEGLDVPTVEPRIQVVFPDAGKVQFIIRVPVPTKRSNRIEHAITDEYLKMR